MLSGWVMNRLKRGQTWRFVLGNPGAAVEATAREAYPPVIPVSRPYHEYGVDRIDQQRANGLQKIGDGGSSGAWVSVIVGHIGKQVRDARTVFFLHEDIAMITIGGDG